jgi:hypothetical protein
MSKMVLVCVNDPQDMVNKELTKSRRIDKSK